MRSVKRRYSYLMGVRMALNLLDMSRAAASDAKSTSRSYTRACELRVQVGGYSITGGGHRVWRDVVTCSNIKARSSELRSSIDHIFPEW